MTSFYPPLDPYQKHYLHVSNLHKIYFEESGNPKGIPILFLHGGPGGGTEPDHRRLYDPNFFRIILVDQRGSGLSVPFAELAENTTWDLVADLEKVRAHLNIDSWLVHGGSWGTTLALVYSISHPNQVLGLVLRAIFLCNRAELLWLYQEGANWVFPDRWQNFQNFIPENERHDFMAAYYWRLTSGDQATQLEAAKIWSMWEASASKLIPSEEFINTYAIAQKALPFARIESHYFHHQAFLPTDNFILENAAAIRNIPTRIIHGRYDMVCPLKSAWQLHQALPQSKLEIIPLAGHSLFEPPILSAVIAACHELGNAVANS
jgi:proline iminopeptidase